jgi:hypothetical protein
LSIRNRQFFQILHILHFKNTRFGTVRFLAGWAPPAAALAPLRAQAESQGSGDFSPLWSGQNATGCRVVPAARLTQELAAGL